MSDANSSRQSLVEQPPERGVANPALRVGNLRKSFLVESRWLGRKRTYLHAVRGVSFAIEKGETLGLVGESGCGKTTLARAILQLIRPETGSVYVGDSPDLCRLSQRELRPYRRRIQMIFQDPYSSLNPRMTVGSIVGEPLIVHRLGNARERQERVCQLLEEVGLPARTVTKFPHEFSGGQRQRIGIARALAADPEVILADEPVSALDVSIRSQIINLLERLQDERQLSFLLISHDLSVVAHLSHWVAVMYLGEIVEYAPKRTLFSQPRHPYTKALLAAVPRPDPRRRGSRLVLSGDVPSPLAPPSGCPFHPRCPERFELCAGLPPPLREVEPGHLVACHLWDPSHR